MRGERIARFGNREIANSIFKYTLTEVQITFCETTFFNQLFMFTNYSAAIDTAFVLEKHEQKSALAFRES